MAFGITRSLLLAALSFGSFDPFDVRHGTHSPCPDADVRKEGASIIADVEMYFTVNGVELRPSPTTVYKGRFEDGANQWSACFP